MIDRGGIGIQELLEIGEVIEGADEKEAVGRGDALQAARLAGVEPAAETGSRGRVVVHEVASSLTVEGREGDASGWPRIMSVPARKVSPRPIVAIGRGR